MVQATEPKPVKKIRPQVGWRIRCRPGRPKPYLAMAKIPGDGTKYESKAFEKEPAARTWAKGRAAELELGIKPEVAEFLPRQTLMVADLHAALLINMRKRDLSEGYIKTMRALLNQVEKVAPNLAHPDTPSRIEALLDRPGRQGEKRLRPRTWNRLITMLGTAIDFAKTKKMLPPGVEPLADIEMRKVPRDVKPQFTLTELRHLLAQAHDHFHLAFACMVLTGMRDGEMLAVEWPDIEFDSNGGGVIVLPDREGRELKTGERIIPLEPELRTLLDPIRRTKGRLIRINRQNFNRRFDAFIAAYGVEKKGRTPHSCRHCYVGLKFATGESPGVVGLYVGHSKKDMTMHYGSAAARFRRDVDGWKRGEMRVMEGITSKIAGRPQLTGVEAARHTLRTGGKYKLI